MRAVRWHLAVERNRRLTPDEIEARRKAEVAQIVRRQAERYKTDPYYRARKLALKYAARRGLAREARAPFVEAETARLLAGDLPDRADCHDCRVSKRGICAPHKAGRCWRCVRGACEIHPGDLYAERPVPNATRQA